jgi:hypothetical protein
MPRLEVHVALVLFWCLLAGVREAEVWVRGVLRGMIAADLVVGAAVSRSQINVLELTVLKTKGNSNKAARGTGGAPGRDALPIPPRSQHRETWCLSQ